MPEAIAVPKTPPGGSDNGEGNTSMTSINTSTVALPSSQKDAIAVDWGEYTQNTTFHGVKYVFEGSRFNLRR